MASIPRAQWRRPVSNAEAAARAGGRAHYNAMRRMMKNVRRRLVIALLSAGMPRKDIAAALGAAPRTIRRDLAAIFADADTSHHCPVCGSGPFVDEADGPPLPWRQRGALAALRRAAAWKAGDLESATQQPFELELSLEDWNDAQRNTRPLP